VRELPRGHGETVMIVDDETDAGDARRKKCLPNSGTSRWVSVQATRPLQAFRADPTRFDLVLTDEAMPDIAGSELAREIRRVRARCTHHSHERPRGRTACESCGRNRRE